MGEVLVTALEQEQTHAVVETAHGPLKVPSALLAIWNDKGWPEDHVIAEMAADERWRP